MYELYPYFTNDGSIGLFSPEADDIYHSTYGALTEAYEKFIIPAELDTYFENNSQIKVLDICYGIGYNSKSFLNFILEKNILKFEKNIKKNHILKYNIATIYTNKIFNRINKLFCIYKRYTDKIFNNKDIQNNISEIRGIINNNDTIYSNNILQDKLSINNKKYKIYLKVLDTDKNLFYLSPFFRQGNKNDKKYNKLNFNYEKITKLLNNEFNQKYQLDQNINLLIFKYIINNCPDIFEDSEILRILNSKKYKPFFDQKLCAYFKLLRNKRSKYTLPGSLYVFLHNIYYSHVSTSYKKALNGLKINNFIFEHIIADARQSILSDNNIYNFIFLDAFTPAKCPALWSLEFFKLLFEHLDVNNGMILTYSNSAAVRNAMINAGFFVGKIFNKELNKFTGTIATKNKTLIKHELSEFDLGLINSKAGIFYRDENLNQLNEQIIATHQKEVYESDKISSSKYIKQFKLTTEN